MIKWNQKGRHDLRRVFLFGAGYGNRTRLLGLGSRCTTDVLILQIWIALRAMIREYSGGGAASVTLRILIWRGRQICVRCAPAALTRQKCLCSPPPPRMPKPMYYRCTNPAYVRSGAGTCAVRLFYHPAARFATVLCRFVQISPAGAARRGSCSPVGEHEEGMPSSPHDVTIYHPHHTTPPTAHGLRLRAMFLQNLSKRSKASP